MSHRLHLARLPSRLQAAHALILEDFLALAHQSKHGCLRAAIEMCADLHQNGMDSRHIKHLGGPLYELKKRVKDGGARVYFFRLEDGFVLVHAECKTEDEANRGMLQDALRIIQALGDDQLVLS